MQRRSVGHEAGEKYSMRFVQINRKKSNRNFKCAWVQGKVLFWLGSFFSFFFFSFVLFIRYGYTERAAGNRVFKPRIVIISFFSGGVLFRFVWNVRSLARRNTVGKEKGCVLKGEKKAEEGVGRHVINMNYTSAVQAAPLLASRT